MSTILVYAPALGHMQEGHPESNARLKGLLPFLDKFSVLSELKLVDPAPATAEQLRRAHTAGLIEHVRQVSRQGGGLLDYGDTYATAESYNLALLAAGSCCAAVDAIMSGQAANGFALVRPPGHHAETDRAGGFCLFNNVAVAARQAQTVHGARRVFILDFDVHHGNGTQDIFYQDDSVLFASIHLFAPYFYPGVGSLGETGAAQGQDYTINVPLPPHVGDEGYDRVLEEVVRPKAAAFKPDVMLVSVGFDAHWQDPLAMGGLTLTGYARLARALMEIAGAVCNGRILFVLEGGYRLEALRYGILNVIYALLGRDEIRDPLGPMPHPEQDIGPLLQQLKERHLLY